MLFRQRFGDLRAGHDGLLSSGCAATRVYVLVVDRPRRSAGPARPRVGRPGRPHGGRRRRTPVAPTRSAPAHRGRRAVLRVGGDAVPPAACAVPTPQKACGSRGRSSCRQRRRTGGLHHVRGRRRPNIVLLREDLVDYSRRTRSGLGRVPDAPAARLLRPSTPRDRWCWAVAAPACDGCSRRAAPAPAARGTSTPATGTPTFTTLRQQRDRRPQLDQQQPVHGRHRDGDTRGRTATTATTGPTSGSRSAATRPRRSRHRSATTSTRRGRTCSRCTTRCTTGRTTSASPRRRSTCSAPTSVGAAGGERPRAGQRPGGRHQPAALPGFAAGTTPTRSPARRAWHRSPTCTCGSRSPRSFYAAVRRR